MGVVQHVGRSDPCGEVSTMAHEEQDPIRADNEHEGLGAASAASIQDDQPRTSRNPSLQSQVNASDLVEAAQRIAEELRATLGQLVATRSGSGVGCAPAGTLCLDRRNEAIAQAREELNERLKASLDAVMRQLELTQEIQQRTVN